MKLSPGFENINNNKNDCYDAIDIDMLAGMKIKINYEVRLMTINYYETNNEDQNLKLSM